MMRQGIFDPPQGGKLPTSFVVPGVFGIGWDGVFEVEVGSDGRDWGESLKSSVSARCLRVRFFFVFDCHLLPALSCSVSCRS